MYQLLVLSQVVLSLQLAFAVVPLVKFTGSKQKMGPFANRPWVQALAWLVTAAIIWAQRQTGVRADRRVGRGGRAATAGWCTAGAVPRGRGAGGAAGRG